MSQGSPEEITSRSSSNTITDDLENVSCPICFKIFNNLLLLNTHLDTDHGFSDTVDDSREYIDRSQTASPNKTKHEHHSNHIKRNRINHVHRPNHIKNKHWKRYSPGLKCHHCHLILNKDGGIRNCRKCGNLFCKRHCRNIIRLNFDAEYDPNNGKWYNCCYSCYSLRSGYNDFGTRVDLTSSFMKSRNSKSEDKALRNLQLENRLIRLIDGIIRLYKRYNGNILLSLKLDYEISNFERSVTPWRSDDNASNCNICQETFNLIVRKHHCRLCGLIVCDNKERGCSSELLVRFLQKVTSDIDYREAVPENPEFNKTLRLCSKCLEMIYVPRRFSQDISAQPSKIFSKYYSLQNLSAMISKMLPQFEDVLSRIEITKEKNNIPGGRDIKELGNLREKVLRSFSSYNLIAKQLLAVKPTNQSEKLIQDSIKIVSANFINEKILPMKNIPSILSSASSSNDSSTNNSLNGNDTPEIKKFSELMSNLSIKEIKEYREELMVYKEQSFILQSAIDDSKKQRRFDEVQTLSTNLKDISDRIHEIQEKLGEQGFD